MTLRRFLAWAESEGHLVQISCPVDPHLEMARLGHALEGRLVRFADPRRPGWQVVTGVCSRREYFAQVLDTDVTGIVSRLVQALNEPSPPPLLHQGSCQDVVNPDPDLWMLPVLKHLPADGGPYITSGISIIKDPDHGRNTSFHRLMQIGPRHLVARVVEGRGTDSAWRKAVSAGRDLDVAICVGAPVQCLLAAAMSPDKGVDELAIAHALAPTPLARCQTKDLEVPAHCEIVLEGRITAQMADEGPFIDLTETWDGIRQQPVIEIDCITHREKPIFHALMPGGMEHKLLMGLPREPTIFQAVSEVVDCQAVCISPGGMSWLHAVVQIKKQDADDGRRAIDAAFRGHGSLKHVVVVDSDVDPFDMAAVEWSIATRFQADRDLMVFVQQPSSSLDPSATQVPGQKAKTAKMGLDATIPWSGSNGQGCSQGDDAFRKVAYEALDPGPYMDECL